ncbi:MAG: pyridoxal phosphate-dependent aminotransferase [Candidatus Diapherotrites archaeon]|nr:pyridoxal phosphate-dependent aminotransferase [Candidatus Diapherotrites archaeon]
MFSKNRGMERIMKQPYAFDVVEQNKELAIKKFGKEYIIDFGIGDPSDPTPEEIREKCKKAVDERKDSGYPQTLGHFEFREAVCKWIKKRFNVSLSENDIIATYGAKYACFHIPLCFTNPNNNDFVLIPNPGYPPYTEGTLLANAEPYYLNLTEDNNFEPNVEEIEKDVVKKSKIIFVNSPHSPTGRIYKKEKLKEIVDFCIDNEIILVSDECYSELYFSEKSMSILNIKNAEDCAIVLNSLSKRSMMTGYAVGFYASKNEDLLKTFKVLQQKSVQGVATFIQDAAAFAYLEDKHVEKMRNEYKKRVEIMVEALRSIGCEVSMPEGTFYIWTKTPKNKNPLEFSRELLLEKGINSTPGNLISKEFKGKNPGKDYVRFAMVQSIEKTKEAAERILELKR